jgi:hypothetical protein
MADEADEPNAVIDLLDSELLTGPRGRDVIFLQRMQMRQQAVTSIMEETIQVPQAAIAPQGGVGHLSDYRSNSSLGR